jgi:hypothetical protein
LKADPILRFAFRLAHDYHTPITTLLDDMSADWLSYELAYADLEPYGSRVEDLRTGHLVSAFVSPYVKGSPPSPSDCAPVWNREPIPWEVSQAVFKAMAQKSK